MQLISYIGLLDETVNIIPIGPDQVIKAEKSVIGYLTLAVVPIITLGIAFISFYLTAQSIKRDDPIFLKAHVLPIGVLATVCGVLFINISAAGNYANTVLLLLAGISFFIASVSFAYGFSR